LLGREHVHEAFSEARDEGNAVLAFTDHDFRDIRPDIEKISAWINSVRADFPSVAVEFATASEIGKLISASREDIRFSTSLNGNTLEVKLEQGTPFSHQPFLAIKTKTGTYCSDNFDQGADNGLWRYVFDAATFQLSDIASIGVAITGENASVHTTILDV
jgi:hypothetical protein